MGNALPFRKFPILQNDKDCPYTEYSSDKMTSDAFKAFIKQNKMLMSSWMKDEIDNGVSSLLSTNLVHGVRNRNTHIIGCVLFVYPLTFKRQFPYLSTWILHRRHIARAWCNIQQRVLQSGKIWKESSTDSWFEGNGISNVSIRHPNSCPIGSHA